MLELIVLDPLTESFPRFVGATVPGSDRAALSRVHGDVAALNPSGPERPSSCRAAEQHDFASFQMMELHPIPHLADWYDRTEQDIKFARVGKRAAQCSISCSAGS
ncbi:MAG TPA: hypothetical protein VNX23_09865 [Bradyrhizobium sp.]|uniref:hypothetical protein n=1 Tax=Bradyrhizobium sp. TaxID=376 RepID=UPI002B9DA844|nr:hypothetical protein [Bradyrhizobium sp.]HXB77692.1 hypothetical protein [Bradyrhizobium sp.]